MSAARFTYTVRYRRAGWEGRRARYFRNREAAFRLVDKLRAPTYLAPVVELQVERQALGPVETVWTLNEEEVAL